MSFRVKKALREVTAITTTSTDGTDSFSPAGIQAAGAHGATLYHKLIAATAGFLMFEGELLAGRRLLPEFGGAAYVWCSVILFFQLVLIVGYYGSRRLSAARTDTRTWILVILGLSGLGTLAPRLPEAPWLPAELQPLVALFPFAGLSVALFTTTPLLHRRQADRSDYRIYAWSNAGALLGLLCYPLVVEPLTDLSFQNWVWAIGGLLVATVGLAGPTVAADAAPGETSTGKTRWQWWVLPAVASALLLATTNRLSYEASAGPLTWALPLAVFLGTYVWAFSARRTVPAGIAAILGLTALAVANIGTVTIGEVEIVLLERTHYLLLVLLAVGGTAMLAANAWLAATRNENTHGFYRATAIGGAIGSAFVVLVVPRVTLWPIEFPILVIATLAVVGFLKSGKLMRVLVAAAAGAAIGSAAYDYFKTEGREVVRARTLYGSLLVRTLNDGRKYELTNNGTLHGSEDFNDPLKGLTYYGPDSGVAILIREKQGEGPSIKIGAIGLGAGTISWHLRPEDLITYYEIDPKVEELSRKYFDYLQHGKTRIIIGDARKSLEVEDGQGYDLIVLDAFSGDAIPTHLLTKEAGAIYRRHLKPDGVVAVHTSNRYVNLAPVVMGLAKNMGMSAELTSDDWSTWVMLRPGRFVAPDTDVIEWTDQRSSVLPVLK